MNMFESRDLVNLRYVLPDEDIEELLCEVVSSPMPSCRMNLAKCVEFFSLGLLFCSSFPRLRITLGIIFNTQMNT